MPGEPGRAPPPTAVEVWPSVAPFGEADRISVSIIALAFLCSSAGSTFASPGGNNHTWPPTAQTTGLDQVSDPGIAARPARSIAQLTISPAVCLCSAALGMNVRFSRKGGAPPG
jgi:hypothetical protein